MKRETEFERALRRHAEEDEVFLGLFDAASDALTVMPTGDKAMALARALGTLAPKAKYARENVKRWEQEQSRKANEVALIEERKGAVTAYVGEKMRCGVRTTQGGRWMTSGRCTRPASFVFEDFDEAGPLHVCLQHRNVWADDPLRGITRKVETDWRGVPTPGGGY